MRHGFKRIAAALLTLVISLGVVIGSSDGYVNASTVSVNYAAHVQNVGWQNYVADGSEAGTSGRGLRMEALKMNISGDYNLGIRYRSHVENIGWETNWSANDSVTGTVGRGLRIEAIQIELTGTDAANYDVYYTLHVQNLGWLRWAKNGEIAGTTGCSLRVEGIKVMIVPKNGGSVPTSDSRFSPNPSADLSVSYKAHVQNIGWQGEVSNGNTAGTSGRGLRMEGIRINVTGNENVGVRYKSHIEDIGWGNWQTDGATSGTTGRGLRLEAIRIELTGPDADCYDIYYRTHCQNYGWLGWAKNGESSGTASCSYRMEAIQIVVLPKGSAAPGDTTDPYMTRPIMEDPMDIKAQDYTSPTNYLILIDKSTFTVAIYERGGGSWVRVESFGCTIGAPGHDTIEGVFHVQGRRYYFDSYGVRCFYATGFCGDYMIHSTLYNKLPTPSSPCDSRIGQALSHGCVRVELSNAEWIYNHIPGGTTVVVYH